MLLYFFYKSTTEDNSKWKFWKSFYNEFQTRDFVLVRFSPRRLPEKKLPNLLFLISLWKTGLLCWILYLLSYNLCWGLLFQEVQQKIWETHKILERNNSLQCSPTTTGWGTPKTIKRKKKKPAQKPCSHKEKPRINLNLALWR